MLDDKNNKAVRDLLSKAESQGFLTLDDIMEAFPHVEDNLEQLEDLFIFLSEEGIQVLYGDDKTPPEEEEAGETEEQVKAPSASSVEPPVDPSFDLSEIASDDTISLYLKEMARVPLLTAEQEVTLARQLEEGLNASERLRQNGNLTEDDEDEILGLADRGEASRSHLIRANTRLVVSIAKRYLGQGVPFLDLIQEGNLGLI